MQTHASSRNDAQSLDLVGLVATGLAPMPWTEPGRDDASRRSEPTWLDRLDQWFWKQQQQEVEDYVAGSADIFEVEARLRELEHRVERSLI